MSKQKRETISQCTKRIAALVLCESALVAMINLKDIDAKLILSNRYRLTINKLHSDIAKFSSSKALRNQQAIDNKIIY